MKINRKRSTVECVVINYKRPENMPLILRRFREQTYPCTVTLVDVTGDLEPETYALAHRVYTLGENYGPWNRYVLAGNYHRDFTYFHDNDMLPGRELINHFVTHAEAHPEGALFGQHGRVCTEGYNPADPPEPWFPCSLIIRGYFLKTDYLWALLKFARHFTHPISEDDVLLSWSIRAYTEKLIYQTPKPENPSELMNEEELPAPYACCRREAHRIIRDRIWRQCEKLAQEIRAGENTSLKFRENGGVPLYGG